ncbi:hypothetical protein [Novosphingobium album (ex Liu et al. 2023)]|uniref:GDT1 family protein n=1 Tax=Novosphingobium album (ex Liu et al. 2023) TaxID=3031130 RepID=A0ABT5WMX4_9SPHN|nr:hypothetical protein [Novosphingobium album (ex Liu et al. 2023)]MDE8650278.1 hypothetical protein [Novosphingobium album (ex Liu et al. 2023)]
MASFYFTLLAVLLSGIGARDQVTVAGLVLRQGARPGVLVTGALVCIASASFAAWAATYVIPLLGPQARPILAAIALGLAGLESMILAPRASPREPTHSLGALALVLAAHQFTDAARFLVFGVAVGTGAAIPAGMAGSIGGIALVAAGWALPEVVTSRGARIGRRIVGLVLLLAALIVLMRARGML